MPLVEGSRRAVEVATHAWHVLVLGGKSFSEFLRKDQIGKLAPLLVGLNLTVYMDQQQGERSKSLLTINDKFLTILVADDNRAEEVVPVLLNRATLVSDFVAL